MNSTGANSRRSLALDRLDALADRIQITRALIRELGGDPPGTGASGLEGGPTDPANDNRILYQRLSAWYDKAVNENLILIEQQQLVFQAEPPPTDDDWIDGWSTLVSLEATIDRVVDGTLEIVGGATVRGMPGAELAGRADSLLQSFAGDLDIRGFDRLTLFSTSEKTRTDSWIIYARFPLDIWSLPIVAHEFGHVVVERFQDSSGDASVLRFVRETVKRTSIDWLSVPRLIELLADGIATLLVGPAYPASLIWHAHPHDVDTHSGTHPSWAARFAVCAAVLDAMALDRRIASDVRTLIKNRWRADRGHPPVATDASHATLVLDIVTALHRVVAPESRFRWTALPIKRALLAGDELGRVDIRQLMNAAWIARIEAAWERPSVLTDRANKALLEATT